jgi:hypothetical protein
MRKQSFILEACHMPGTVVGCHLLCSGFSLARRVVLQLFVQTYHRLLSASGTSITNAYSMRTSSRIMHTFPFMQTHFKLLGICTSLNSKSLCMQTQTQAPARLYLSKPKTLLSHAIANSSSYVLTPLYIQ